MRFEKGNKNPALFLGNESGCVDYLLQKYCEGFGPYEYLKQNVQTVQHGQEHVHAPLMTALRVTSFHLFNCAFRGTPLYTTTWGLYLERVFRRVEDGTQ